MSFFNRSNRLFGKLSFKAKIVIFTVLCFTAAALITYNKYTENKINRALQDSKVKSDTQLKAKDDAAKTKSVEENKALQDKQKSMNDKYNQAHDAFFNKNYDLAIKLADELIAEDPSYYMAYNIKGITQCYGNDYENGMKNIDKSLEIKPDFPYGRFNKALANELYGHYDEAINWYNKALEVDKNNPWSYYGIASIYGRKGDVENTVKYLKQAIALDNAIKAEAAKEADFNPVKNSPEFKALIN
ncbi:tetratricopeptide repeat protein [Clostridium sp. JN-9]|mgnify:FL=1|uniref:tetratricopeptide repeat protein n=1 Tax=Clostridium sp. JN-9 TaxID=2507159 RepID=UPI000FFE2B3C|nr:tetratricopeptide repeat protein [Clostridium sp. JN-9]QAT41349.1 tetratricopeptide repeat protein [Clostridium sp. JN-9]